MIRFHEKNLSYSYIGHRFSFTLGFGLVVDFSRCCTRSGGVSADLVRCLSISLSRSGSSTLDLDLASCWSRSLFLEIVSHREPIAPEIVRACRY